MPINNESDSSAMPYIELLAPAGNPEKLEIALHYGADAAYLSDARFGLRAGAGNFTLDEMAAAVHKAHGLNKRIYVAVNIFAHGQDVETLPEYLLQLKNMDADALIVSDPGVVMLAREHVPDMELHLSTQANTLNAASVRFWQSSGVARIVLARELTLDEISAIHREVPDMELEAFVHGSMCMAYSGRCFISNYMTGRDANKGDCTNSCRWNYALMENKRPGEYFPIEEDQRGTYFFNSKDLNLLAELPRIISAGVSSLKIEGRGKSIHYLASTVATYRAALDAFQSDPDGFTVHEEWRQELLKIPHRGYTKGFLDGAPTKEDGYAPDKQKEAPGYQLVGIVREADKAPGIRLDAKNKIEVGDQLECLTPSGVHEIVMEALFDERGKPVDVLKPGFTGYLPRELGLHALDILRKHVTTPP